MFMVRSGGGLQAWRAIMRAEVRRETYPIALIAS